MGLSMAQTYDPQYNTQMTITSGMYYTFLVLLFLAGNGHVRLMALIYSSARLIPFGEVVIRPELSALMLEIFKTSIATGLQLVISDPGHGTCDGDGGRDSDAYYSSDQCVCSEFSAEDHCRPDDAFIHVHSGCQ